MSFFCANFSKVCLTYHVSNMLLKSNAWNGLSVTDFIQNATPVAFVLCWSLFNVIVNYCFSSHGAGVRLRITARDWQRSELTSSYFSRFRHKYNKKHCRSLFDDFAFLLMACYGVGSGTMVHIARLQVNRPSVVPLAVWAVNKTAPPTTQTWVRSTLDQQQQQFSNCKPTNV
jgi:hypothetical protein